MRFLRTVIGSFPRLNTDDLDAIDEAVRIQLRNNIDLLSDGEQRGDMITYLARDIPGLSIENDRCIVSEKISPPEDPMNVQKITDYFMVRKKYPDLKFKVTLTGPTALGVTCASNKLAGEYRSIMDFSLYADLATALAEIVRPLAKANAHIQIDEPFLSQGFSDLKKRIRLIDELLDGCKPDLVSIHVCGYLGKQPILEELAKLRNVSILSHAFSAGQEKKNLVLLEQSIFEDNGKKLGAGIISVLPTRPEKVETPETVSSRLLEIISRIGVENIGTVHPDCGLLPTKPDLIESLLNNFNAGVRQSEHSLQ